MSILSNEDHIDDYIRRAGNTVEPELAKVDDATVRAQGAEYYIDEYMRRFELQPLKERTRVRYEDHSTSAAVVFSFVPHPNNRTLLRMGGGYWTTAWDGVQHGQYDDKTGILTIFIAKTHEAFDKTVTTVREIIKEKNGLIKDYRMNQLSDSITHAVRTRMARAEEEAERGRQFAEAMRERGVELIEKPGAVRPVDVTVRQEVSVLRETTPEPEKIDPSVSEESVKKIVALLHQAGRGFEKAPQVYGTLGEEALTMIVIGYLNAVFEVPAAHGEAFSKTGKADILLEVPDGKVLWSCPVSVDSERLRD
jgi:hypothetical protein